MGKKSIDKLYSLNQIREKFLPGYSRAHIVRLMEDGEIAPVFHEKGKKWLIPESSIKNYLNRLVPYEPPRPQQGRRAEAGVGAKKPSRLRRLASN